MSQAIITTTDGLRIAKRLTNHWQHKFQISSLGDTGFVVHFPSAEVVLLPSADALQVEIRPVESSSEPMDLAKLQSVVASHIDRMAGEAFDYQWHDA